jgi:hypothetical protein
VPSPEGRRCVISLALGFFPAAGSEFSRFAPPQPECPFLSFSQSTAPSGGSPFSVLGLRVSRRSAAAPCQVPAPPRARFSRSGVFSRASVPLALGLSGPSTSAPRRHNRCRVFLLLRFSLRCCSRFRSRVLAPPESAPPPAPLGLLSARSGPSLIFPF